MGNQGLANMRVYTRGMSKVYALGIYKGYTLQVSILKAIHISLVSQRIELVNSGQVSGNGEVGGGALKTHQVLELRDGCLRSCRCGE